MYGVTRTQLPKGDEMEIRIVVYSPVKVDQYIADVYLNGVRMFCGNGIHATKQSAFHQASSWLDRQMSTGFCDMFSKGK